MKLRILLYILFLGATAPVIAQTPAEPVAPTYRYATVKAEQIVVPGVKNESGYATLPSTSKRGVITYVDGLGRPLASMAIKANPGQNDLVSLFDYDNMGRKDHAYLPYAANLNGTLGDRAQMLTDLMNFYNNSADQVADDAAPYARNIYENAPLLIVKEKGEAGTAWQPGTGHTSKTEVRVNTTNEIRIWRDNLASPGYYAAGTVRIQEHTDENGNKTKAYTDLEGKLLETHKQVSATEWIKTLYIYDRFGRQKYVIQPEGVKQIGASTTISTPVLDQQSFQYTYDKNGRVVEMKAPGVAPNYYCYDPLGRLALMQDGNLRQSNQWIFQKYDRKGRPVMSGVYTNATHTTRVAVQQNLLDVLAYTTGETFYEKKQAGTAHGYSNQSFPTSGTEVQHVTYYDTYDLDANGTADYSYAAQGLSVSTPEGLVTEASQAATVGSVTATKVNILGTTNWITSYLFYDKVGNLIQVRQNNHKSLTAFDNLTTALYDFSGKLRLRKVYHSAGGANNTTVVNRYDYDHAGRVRHVYQKNNSDAEVVMATYKYNALGQLVDKSMTGADDNYIQSVDYRYAIRGWLESINNADLLLSSSNDETDDLFGMNLFYNTADPGVGNTASYNGSISAVKWKLGIAGNADGSDRRSYKYTYDKSGRLTGAAYQEYTPGTGSWTTEAGTLDETMTYDGNGNIKALQRSRPGAGAGAFTIVPQTIDDLAYTYATGNQLSKVEDASGDAAGFSNNATATTEYTYDSNGNLTADLNKGISSIIYNVFGKPTVINFTDGRKVEYTYDASGAKLTMKNYQGTTLLLTTDYVGAYVYENDVLKFFGAPEGRVVKNGSALEYQFALQDHQGNTRALFGKPYETANLVAGANADCNTTTGFTANQNVTLAAVTQNGNTYVRVQSNQSTSTPGAWPIGSSISVQAGQKYTFKVKGYDESATGGAYLYVRNASGSFIKWTNLQLPNGADNEDWVSYDVTVPDGVTDLTVGVLFGFMQTGDRFYLNKVGIYRHQDDDFVAGFETASQTAEAAAFNNYQTGKIINATAYAHSGSRSYRLTGSTSVSNEVIGPAKSMRVYPGDVVNMEVYGKYMGTTGGATNVGGVIAAALQSAFGLSAGGGTDAAYQSISSLFGGGAIIGTVPYPYEDDAPPKAFINYILFDDNYTPYDIGYDQIDASGIIPGSGNKMSLTAKVRKPGYIYIYLSNESDATQEVYFDDLKIKHVKSPVIQGSEYYAFGMQTSQSWMRDNHTGNPYLYNAGSELNKASGWYETPFRGYDAALGRFMQVDALAAQYERWTPYVYSMNDPINRNDPTGLYPNDQDEWDGGGPLVNTWTQEYTGGGNFGGGFNWSSQYATVASNYAMMSTAEFEAYYGVDLSTDEGKWFLLQRLTSEPYTGDVIVSGSYGNADRKYMINHGTLVGYYTYAVGANGGPGEETYYALQGTLAKESDNILDWILDLLPGERYHGSEVLVSVGTNIQYGIRGVGKVTFNPFSQVLYNQTWANDGDSFYVGASNDGTVRLHQEFGIQAGFGISYKNVWETRDEIGSLDGMYKSDNYELAVSWMGLTVQLNWGTQGVSIFYGGKLGVGAGIGLGGSADTWHGNVIRF